MLNSKSNNLNFTLGAIALVGIIFVYVWLFLGITANYLPVWSDEFFYYTNAASFFENSTLKAALTYSGKGSVFLGADAHGFAYPLLNGGFAKVFGWKASNFIVINLLLVFIAIAMVWVQKNITTRQKYFVTTTVLLFPFFMLYGFTFMQESIHIFFGIVSSILIYSIYKEGRRKDILLFILCISIAALFRPLWFFWLIAIVPFAKNKLQRNIFTGIFLLGAVAAFGLASYIGEPVPNYFSSLTHLLQQGDFKLFFLSAAKHLAYNVYAYFTDTNDTLIYLPIKYIIVLPFLFFATKAIKTKSKLYTSIALVGLVNFALLFLVYDVFKWREIRVLAPFFYFTILFLITETNLYFKYAQWVMLCILFVLALPLNRQWMQSRNIHSKDEISRLKQGYNEIAQKVEANATILLNFTPPDSSLDLIVLPVKNSNNMPIRYIVPYYNVEKVKYNYSMEKAGMPLPGNIIFSNKYYQLASHY